MRRQTWSGRSRRLGWRPHWPKIEAQLEVDSNVSGQTWQVSLFHDGEEVFSGARQTRGASGSFELRKVTGDNAGTDTFKAKVTHGSEVCRASASF